MVFIIYWVLNTHSLLYFLSKDLIFYDDYKLELLYFWVKVYFFVFLLYNLILFQIV